MSENQVVDNQEKQQVDHMKVFTDQFVEMVKEGKMPFQKPIEKGEVYGQQPFNAVTGNEYKGLNALRLIVEREKEGYSNTGWATLNQISQNLDTSIFKGSHGALVTDTKMLENPNIESGVEFNKSNYYVFNIDNVRNGSKEIEAQSAKITKNDIKNIQATVEGFKPEQINGQESKERDYLAKEIASFMIAQKYGAPHTPQPLPDNFMQYLENLQGKPMGMLAVSKQAQDIVNEVDKIPSLKGKAAENTVVTKESIQANKEAYKASKAEEREGAVYLSVPFDRKDEAKELGAKFDGQKKLWYAPAGADMEKFTDFKRLDMAMVADVAKAMAIKDPQEKAGAIVDVAKAHVTNLSQAADMSTMIKAADVNLNAAQIMNIVTNPHADVAKDSVLEGMKTPEQAQTKTTEKAKER